MKKLILTFIAVVAFTFSAVAQCPSYSTPINTSCGSYCAYVQVTLTGSLEADIPNLNETDSQLRRPLTTSEFNIVYNALESQCD